MINLTPHRGFGATNEINLDNYKDLIIKVGISKLPPALLKGHHFYSSNKSNYGSSEAIRETINDYLADLNQWVSKLPAARRKEIFDTGYSYSQNKSEGKKYKATKNYSIKELAKLIKEELKIEFEGEAEFSVTTGGGTTTSSIDVEIVDLQFNPYTADFLKALNDGQTIAAFNEYKRDGWNRSPDRFNEQFYKLSEKAEKIMNQYNYDDSDSMTDYFDRRYYGGVRFNENKYLIKHFPDSPDAKRYAEHEKYWDEKKRKSSEIAAQRKGRFKKGEILFLNAEMHQSWHKYKMPNGFYLVKVVKSPNGRGFANNYLVSILEDINLLLESTKLYHKKNNYEKYYIKNDYGTFTASTPVSAYESNLFPLNADAKIFALQKARQQAIKILKNK